MGRFSEAEEVAQARDQDRDSWFNGKGWNEYTELWIDIARKVSLLSQCTVILTLGPGGRFIKHRSCTIAQEGIDGSENAKDWLKVTASNVDPSGVLSFDRIPFTHPAP